MNKYIVYIKEVHEIPVEVEAEFEEDARNIASEMLNNDDRKINFDRLEYLHTEEPYTWKVEKV
jgi:hypothetical protein